MGRVAENFIGSRHNRLLVIERDWAPKAKTRDAWWTCICDCGNKTSATTQLLKSGGKKSCGCLRVAVNTTHGMTSSRPYKIWLGMKERCLNPNSDYYTDYGGRGICIYSCWLDFSLFWDDVKIGYSDEFELDRVDVNGNYCPENCRWVDSYQQAYNKRKYKSNTLGTTGVTFDKRSGRFQARISVKGKRISLGTFETLELATKAREEAEIKYYGGLKHA